MITTDLTMALPEIFLACAATTLLLFGAFRGEQGASFISALSVAVLAIAFGLIFLGNRPEGVAFGGLFVVDAYGDYMKLVVLVAAGFGILMTQRFIEREGMDRFEIPVLMVLATLGMLMMISANDLMSLYVGLELQSLSLYVIAAIRRENLKSSEAGLKYFVLGALSSGMLLYGSSMVYGFTGATDFAVIGENLSVALSTGGVPEIGLIVGLVFICAAIAFKISAVPFHMWTPDVYEGAPTPVTAFFASAPKVAGITLFARILSDPFGSLVGEWQQIIVFVALASMILGSLAAIKQTNIKRLMAYSSIGNIGYALVGLAAGTQAGIEGLLIYMTIYIFMNMGTFACILSMRQKGTMVESIEDLKGLSKTSPLMAFALTVFMFSMAGIPPLAGFFGKYVVFAAAVDAGLTTLAVIGVLTSVIGAFYYLRIIKVMYFDEPTASFDKPIGGEMTLVLTVSSVFIVFFILFSSPIMDGAALAASALFAG
ncbi:NADH-quinone oxidoreductase subunit NuoN [Kiloniella laminariae]|uniref:NADH-quinone oxidoreductase subunit N n=1 Tax=Kiloniella laminariae TaxID=454162 RepID=A0ABT4LLM6_9PROT|nr:NADH-quinone oxidoreductase subunit NuoN [Kiloniella laminariae]MCZ4282011.1 NADH-quinone oxidoreductase subunit NuoN [Kiloniella laminariae]